MSPALLQLLLLSLKGRFVRWIRLLRNPRYAVGFLIGLAYFGWFLGRPFLAGGIHVGPNLPVSDLGPSLHLGLALLAAGAFTLVWAFQSGRPALRLGQAEIELLMPAPISRRRIIEYALLKDQPALLLGAGLISLRRPVGFPAIWLVLTVANLHTKGCALWKARLKELPSRSAWARRIGIWLALLVYWAALILVIRSGLQGVAAPDGGDMKEFLPRMVTLVEEARALRFMLAPFLLFTAPVAASGGSRWMAWGAVAVLAVLHHAWVVRSRVRFEEASLEAARRRDARRDPTSRLSRLSKAARGREPFRLAPLGNPETALLWKNMMAQGRRSLLGKTGTALAILVVAAAALALLRGTLLNILSLALLILGVTSLFAALFSAMRIRQDFRMDLLMAETIRPWPIPGHRMFLGQVLTPALLGVLMALFTASLITAVWLGVHLAPAGAPDHLLAELARELSTRLGSLGILAVPWLAYWLVVPLGGLIFLLTAVQNLAALVLPGWVQLGAERPRGPAALGQNILRFLGLNLVLLVGLIPSVTAGLLYVLLHWAGGIPWSIWEAPTAALAVTIPLGGEVWLLTRLGGRVWNRLDPSEILARV